MFKINSNIIKVLALLGVIYAAVVCVGWLFNMPELTGLHPDQINMKFPTAMCFFFSFVGLYSLADYYNGERDISPLVITTVVLIDLLTMLTLLAASVVGLQTGIENLFVVDTLKYPVTVRPGAPALPTMINIILFSVASMTVLLRTRFSNTVVNLLANVIFMVGLLPVVGYSLNIPALYYKLSAASTPIALNTALMFAYMGICLLLINNNHYQQKKDES